MLQVKSDQYTCLCAEAHVYYRYSSADISMLWWWWLTHTSCFSLTSISSQHLLVFPVVIWVLLWSPYVIGRPYIFSCCSLFFFFFPRLISAAADWMFAVLPRMVWPQCEFKMQIWNMPHAARWKHRTQKSRQKSPSGHHRTNLSGYIFTTKARIDNRKKTY